MCIRDRYNESLGREVVQDRFEMLKKLSLSIPQERKSNDFVAIATQLQDTYLKESRPAKRLLEDMWKISRRGLRDYVDLLCKYAWIDHGEVQRSSLNDRFQNTYAPSIMAYMLGGYRRYTQFKGNVPNMFLVNSKAKPNERSVPEIYKDCLLYTSPSPRD